MSFMVENPENLPVPAEGSHMQILIGPENVNEALKDTSVVVASYDIGDNMRGLIGVVGPTRMDYATVAARLSYFAEGLTRMFGKQEGACPSPRRITKGMSKEPRTPRAGGPAGPAGAGERRPRGGRGPAAAGGRSRQEESGRPSPSPGRRWRRWRAWPGSWPR